VRAATSRAPRLAADVRARSATIAPIIRRLGVDALVGRMTRLREDERFKVVTPESAVLPVRGAASAGAANPDDEPAEVWFDWAFVDFFKSNYCAECFRWA
jgi:hypothetical protein